jgi:hypothetical protein
MIASFFRHLELHGVRALLVSGQATILYGAATFSEDVDLWVGPDEVNLERLKAALQASGARYYKLTPPLTAELALRHHGFHFTVPDPSGGMAMFLDVMGCPPRVGAFEDAQGRARFFETAWGPLNTVAIPDLVELKKTQRPRDYPIIGRLVLAYMKDRGAACSAEELDWAISNMFSLSEFKRLVLDHPEVHFGPSARPLASAAETLLRGEVLPASLEDEVEDWFDARMAPLRRADRHFWRPVIDELRGLRAQGKLLPEGTPV